MRTLATIIELVRASGTSEPVRFTAALSDGTDLYAFRYANNNTANSLYYREAGGNVVVVSEPLDMERDVLEAGAAQSLHRGARTASR